MTVSPFRFIPEDTMANGIAAPTAIQIHPITRSSVASLATNITKPIWIISTRTKMVIPIIVQNVYVVIPREMQIKTVI
jgi:hypothetical protein